MAVSFDNIPATIRHPILYAEVDASQAGTPVNDQRALLIGQKLSAGSATADEPIFVSGTDAAVTLFGAGSQLARMVSAFRANDPFTELWCLPVVEPSGGDAAAGSLAFTGPASAAGTLTIYIAGQKVSVAVASGDTATEIGDAVEAAITALTSLPVTAANTDGTVALTAKWKGSTGNDIDVRLNYRGVLGGEATPAGVGVTVTEPTSGSGAPDLSGAITAMGDEPFDFIGHCFTDSTSLDAIETELGPDTGRWAWNRRLYGHAFTSAAGSVSTLSTLGNARNDPHASIMGITGSPTPPWEVAGAFTARAAQALINDPARPIQSLELVGVMAPAIADRQTLSERNVLLYDGVSVAYVNSDGSVRIGRAITTYQKNAYDVADDAWLDVNTPATLWTVLRRIEQRMTSKFPRHKLANDGTRFGPGQAVVTPKVIRAEIIALYRELEFDGLVENVDAFKANLIVERNVNDPNRVDVLLPPDFVNQLRVLAIKAQFRLQYREA